MSKGRRNFEPVAEITMYQARCTECGIAYDSGDTIVAWMDETTAIEQASEYGEWFAEWLGNSVVRLLCRGCQVCEVCGSGDAYDIDDHLVCEDHEDHDFEIAKLGGRA